MARKVRTDLLAYIKQWEGVVLYAYDDADRSSPKRRIMPGMPVRGTLTIGYGHTRGVRPGMAITEHDAERLLREDLAPCEQAVEAIIRAPLTDEQFTALVSFAYNLGHSTAPGSPLSNIAQNVNRHDYAGALRRMALYVKQRQGGQLVTVQGLVNRRAAEAGLWAKGEFVSSAAVQVEDPVQAPTPSADAGILAGVAGAASAIAPAVSGLGGVHWAVGLAIVAGAVGLAAVWLLRRQRSAVA